MYEHCVDETLNDYLFIKWISEAFLGKIGLKMMEWLELILLGDAQEKET